MAGSELVLRNSNGYLEYNIFLFDNFSDKWNQV